MKKGLVCLLLVFIGLGIFADESGVEMFARKHKIALGGGRVPDERACGGSGARGWFVHELEGWLAGLLV
ncbi:MAG: hypothetical protein J6Y30_01295 [Treponema sp.]|nr:hypothetical protein [Treponema sp.]